MPPLISFPIISTKISHIPCPKPEIVSQNAMALPSYTPEHEAALTLEKLDIDRVVETRSNSGRKKGKDVGKSPFSVGELKDLARKLGIQAAAKTKPTLVKEIRNMYSVYIGKKKGSIEENELKS